MEKQPTILAIDTSLGRSSVALWRNGALAHELREDESGEQSRVLIGMIEQVLAKADLGYDECDAVACTIGPGGFTGIRVGLSTARAIALATTKPLIGLSTLEVIAFASQAQNDVVAVIDAYRGEWYAQRFRINGDMTPLSDALLVDEKAKKALSHGAKVIEGVPYAAGVAALAHHQWMQGVRQWNIAPHYIREPDAKLPVS